MHPPPGLLPAAVAVAATLAWAGILPAEPAAGHALAAVTTEELIARFEAVPEKGIAEDVQIQGGAVVVMDHLDVRLGTGLLAEPALGIVHELVRRGAAAVPALLDHLPDARPTGMRLASKTVAGPIRWRYGARYSPRQLDPAALPPGVTLADTLSEDASHSEVYRFTVGDLCFVTLGLVVNRSLAASCGKWGQRDYHTIHSPSHTPALAAARADWAGLTADGLRRSLTDDARRPPGDSFWTPDSLRRLLFYFPEAGSALAVRLLRRPMYVVVGEPDLSLEALIKLDDEQAQDDLLAKFRARYGAGLYRCFVQNLALAADGTPEPSGDPGQDREDARQWGNARKLAARRFAGVNRHSRLDEIGSDVDSQREVLEAVRIFPSPEIDRAVRGMVRRALTLKPISASEKLCQCWLVSAGMQRLLPRSLRRAIARDADRINTALPTDAPARRRFLRNGDRFLRRWARRLPPG